MTGFSWDQTWTCKVCEAVAAGCCCLHRSPLHSHLCSTDHPAPISGTEQVQRKPHGGGSINLLVIHVLGDLGLASPVNVLVIFNLGRGCIRKNQIIRGCLT